MRKFLIPLAAIAATVAVAAPAPASPRWAGYGYGYGPAKSYGMPARDMHASGFMSRRGMMMQGRRWGDHMTMQSRGWGSARMAGRYGFERNDGGWEMGGHGR